MTKLARTANATAEIPGLIDEALATAASAPTGPTFVDFPLDQVFMESDADATRPLDPDPLRCRPPTATRSTAQPSCCAPHPSRSSWRAPGSTGRAASRRWCGSARSCRCRCSSTAWRAAACRRTTRCSSRAHRATALKGADLALVIGVPMDFRLGFGGSLGCVVQHTFLS